MAHKNGEDDKHSDTREADNNRTDELFTAFVEEKDDDSDTVEEDTENEKNKKEAQLYSCLILVKESFSVFRAELLSQ